MQTTNEEFCVKHSDRRAKYFWEDSGYVCSECNTGKHLTLTNTEYKNNKLILRNEAKTLLEGLTEKQKTSPTPKILQSIISTLFDRECALKCLPKKDPDEEDNHILMDAIMEDSGLNEVEKLLKEWTDDGATLLSIAKKVVYAFKKSSLASFIIEIPQFHDYGIDISQYKEEENIEAIVNKTIANNEHQFC